MSIFITGTDGFIGSQLKRYFSSKSIEVRGSVFFKKPEQNEKFLDLSIDEGLSDLDLTGINIIVHTAGVVDQNQKSSHILNINASGTKRLLQTAKKFNIDHFIQLSSISVYGSKVVGQNIKESTKRKTLPLFPYGKSKLIAEQYVESSSIPYTILRLPAVFGANDSYISNVIIPRLITGSFRFFTKNEKFYSTLNVQNMGPLLEKLISHGPLNEAFNCCDGSVTWFDFVSEYINALVIGYKPSSASILRALAHIKDKEYLLMALFSYFGAHFPGDKLTKTLDFTFPFSWRDGVKEAVESFRNDKR